MTFEWPPLPTMHSDHILAASRAEASTSAAQDNMAINPNGIRAGKKAAHITLLSLPEAMIIHIGSGLGLPALQSFRGTHSTFRKLVPLRNIRPKNVTDLVEAMRRFPGLEACDLREISITEPGLARLAGLTQLHRLQLNKPPWLRP